MEPSHAYVDQLRERGRAATQKSLVHDEIDYERIIRAFLSTSCISHRGDQPQGLPAEESDFISVGWHYAQLATRSLELKAIQKQFSSFQFLISLSYLAFLQTKGYSTERIDGLLQLLTHHDERRRRRYIPRAIRINSIIQAIARMCNIGIAPATEVFFLYAMTPRQLLDVSEEDLESIPEIVSRIQCDYETCLTTYYTIPTLLLSLITAAGLATSTSLCEICVALGYNVDTVSSCLLADVYRVDKAARKAKPEPFTILTDPFTQADFTCGYKAATGALTTRVPSTAMFKYSGISKRRKNEPKAVTRSVRNDIPSMKSTPFYQYLEEINNTHAKDTAAPVHYGVNIASHSALATNDPQTVTSYDQSGEHNQLISASEGNGRMNTAMDMGQLGSNPATVLPSEVNQALENANRESKIYGYFDSLDSSANYFHSWKIAAAKGLLFYVAQWPVPRSTDVLRTYWWSTLDAIKLSSSPHNAPAYVDFKTDYYYVDLDEAKDLLPDATLIEAIQQSSLYRQELRQWELSGSHGIFRTSSCIIGVTRARFVEFCILQATVCGLVEEEEPHTNYVHT